MVILIKIVKIGQLQMAVESREPIVHSGFFRLKHTYTKGQQKKHHMKGFCRGPSSRKIPKRPSQNGHKVCCRRMGLNYEIFLISNQIEKLVCIILGRFSNNKTQK